MTWAEVNLVEGVWIIPAQRMKAGKEHRVPLSNAAVALLGRECEPGTRVFAGEANPGKPIWDMGMTAVLRRMNRHDIIVHGFRSTFRDWAGEATGVSREVVEAALAYGVRDKAEAAYARSDLFDKRKRLMEAWANWTAGNRHAANVVVLNQQEKVELSHFALFSGNWACLHERCRAGS